MALLSAVSCKQTSSDVRANLLLPAPRLMGSHRLKSSITSVLISFLSWTLLISSAATWAMPLISDQRMVDAKLPAVGHFPRVPAGRLGRVLP